MSRKWIVRVSVAALVAVGLVGTATVAGAEANSDHIWAGEPLVAGAYQTSNNGLYRLIQQHDGNLVEYKRGSDGKFTIPIWSTGTARFPGAATFLQKDGNLVVYQHGKALPGNSVWASNTATPNVSHLTVQPDGNVVVYTRSGEAIWASQGLMRSAGKIENDYPAKWRGPLGMTTDDWQMATSYCTSFIAYRVATRNGFNVRQNGWWDANALNWDNYFKSKTDDKPRPGAVAQTDYSPGGLGHVAWVAKVSSDGSQVFLEEYNYDAPGGYGTRWASARSYKYIHLND